MPVFNGEARISECITRLLAQDFADFELIISDNASTDSTPDLCASFARLDPRIIFERQKINQGANANFDWVAGKARGDLFMWAAHDDRHERSFISKCIAALDRANDAVLAAPDFIMCYPNGAAPTEHTYPDFLISHPDVVQRLRWIMGVGGWFAIYGLIRRAALARTRPMKSLEPTPAPGLGPDYRIIELAMLGPFVRVAEPLLEYYAHPPLSVDQLQKMLNPARHFKGVMSWWWIKDAWRMSGLHGFDLESRLRIEKEFWTRIRSSGSLRGELMRYNSHLRLAASRDRRWLYLANLWLERLLLGRGASK
jgi:glycosyltransferase involved in cell wall biosynthesis